MTYQEGENGLKSLNKNSRNYRPYNKKKSFGDGDNFQGYGNSNREGREMVTSRMIENPRIFTGGTP